MELEREAGPRTCQACLVWFQSKCNEATGELSLIASLQLNVGSSCLPLKSHERVRVVDWKEHWVGSLAPGLGNILEKSLEASSLPQLSLPNVPLVGCPFFLFLSSQQSSSILLLKGFLLLTKAETYSESGFFIATPSCCQELLLVHAFNYKMNQWWSPIV